MATTIGPFRPEPKGAYSALTEYSLMHWVTDSGNSYLYINETPSTGTALSTETHWLKIASKGDQGDQDIVDAAEAARDLAEGYRDDSANYAAQLQAGIGSPAGSYADLAALNTADPAHDRIYLTEDDWKIAYYDAGTDAFVAGGVYQATATTYQDVFTSLTLKKPIYENLSLLDIFSASNKIGNPLMADSDSDGLADGVILSADL